MRQLTDRERGASGVEVALLVAVVAVAVLGAVQFLGGQSASGLEDANKGLTQTTSDADGGGGSSPGPGSGGGSSGGSGGPTVPGSTPPPRGTSTTTATPSTTAAPTTTAAPATTTTATPTTSTMPPLVAAPTFNNISTWRDGSDWRASTTLDLASGGAPVVGAEVTLTVRTQENKSSSWSTTTMTVTVGFSGQIDLELGPYQRTGRSRIVTVEVQVTAVNPLSGATWDGSTPSASFSRPD